ncbi:putative lipoprotein [Xylanibacter ruminicola 23]|uniref:Lipoprotein n=2 Tax=Xylanibacter ruminicola TaxID=839 RepID=D5EX22_XYLR2|nr:putative lipoprotein [Xylanibacter ruminicola 23]
MLKNLKIVNMKTNVLVLSAGLCLASILSSCTKDTIPTYEEAQKEAYTNSFVAKYGQISPSQSWDFTTGEPNLAKTRGVSTINVEVLEKGVDWGDVSKLKLKHFTFGNAVWNYDIIQSGIQKNADLFYAINSELPEKKIWVGNEVALVSPSSSFYIFPLLSGGLNRYDLKVKVGNEDPVIIFSKDYNFFQTINGMTTPDGKTVNMRGVKIEAPVGTPIEIYLDNVRNENNKQLPTVGTTNGHAVYIDVPENVELELDDIELADDHIAKYIGIEDAIAGTDNDYNDLVLAVVGNPDVPQEKVITENQYEVKTCRAKRYMIEDLGAIGDFDFNDVVVDVEEYTVYTHKVTSENGVKTSDEVISTTTAPTKAFIRALGGTIDFELTIGSTKWVKSESDYDTATMYNTQGNIDYSKALAEFEVSGYNYDNNNITFRANGKDGRMYTVSFPKTGEAPMMIAVDPSTNWMTERTSIPSSWFTKGV